MSWTDPSRTRVRITRTCAVILAVLATSVAIAWMPSDSAWRFYTANLAAPLVLFASVALWLHADPV